MERKVNEVKTIKTNLTGLNALRLTIGMSGITMAVVGMLLSLTIIGAIIGVPMIFLGGAFMVLNVPKHDLQCDNCNYVNTIEINTKSMICEQCDTATPLKWIN